VKFNFPKKTETKFPVFLSVEIVNAADRRAVKPRIPTDRNGFKNTEIVNSIPSAGDVCPDIFKKYIAELVSALIRP
jgi:hypothetical protein